MQRNAIRSNGSTFPQRPARWMRGPLAAAAAALAMGLAGTAQAGEALDIELPSMRSPVVQANQVPVSLHRGVPARDAERSSGVSSAYTTAPMADGPVTGMVDRDSTPGTGRDGWSERQQREASHNALQRRSSRGLIIEGEGSYAPEWHGAAVDAGMKGASLSGAAEVAALSRDDVRESLSTARAAGTMSRGGEAGDTAQVLAAREEFNALQTEVLTAQAREAAEAMALAEQQALDELLAAREEDDAALVAAGDFALAPVSWTSADDDGPRMAATQVAYDAQGEPQEVAMTPEELMSFLEQAATDGSTVVVMVDPQ